MPLNVFIQVLDYKLQNYKSFKSNQRKTYVQPLTFMYNQSNYYKL